MICGTSRLGACDMGLTIKVYTNGMGALKDRLSHASTRAEHAVAVQAAEDTAPYVPMRSGSLRQRTRVVGNQIIYPGPYSRYLYYGKYMIDPQTGRGPFHFFDEDGNEHIKYRKGARLVPTERNLKFWHPGTRSHWFDYSKSKNLAKWLLTAERVIKRGI